MTIADIDPASTRRNYQRLLEEAARFEAEGLKQAGYAVLVRENLRMAESIEVAVEDRDLIEEAVPEAPSIKQAVYQRICRAARPDAILGTNTSTLPVHTLAPYVNHPERFLIIHFSNPAPFISGVEIVRGEATADNVVSAVKTLLKRANRIGAEVADRPAFVLNRLQYALLKEADKIVQEGVATTSEFDTVVRTTFGFRLPFFGPFAIANMAGLDVYADCFKTVEKAYGSRMAMPDLLAEMVQTGAHGVKNGKRVLWGLQPRKEGRPRCLSQQSLRKITGITGGARPVTP
ncbi:MAG: 3-hydroxyacyl-CoA dehydrogenase family protein [Acetobacteraceae bacterium]